MEPIVLGGFVHCTNCSGIRREPVGIVVVRCARLTPMMTLIARCSMSIARAIVRAAPRFRRRWISQHILVAHGPRPAACVKGESPTVGLSPFGLPPFLLPPLPHFCRALRPSPPTPSPYHSPCVHGSANFTFCRSHADVEGLRAREPVAHSATANALQVMASPARSNEHRLERSIPPETS